MVLIPKNGLDKDGFPKLRPISLLSSFDKLYKHLIRVRLIKEMERRRDLTEQQFGFRKSLSTMDAMKQVLEFAKTTNSGPWGRKDFCALTTVDVENVFNSALWDKIIDELKNGAISPNLIAIIINYFTDRSIIVDEKTVLQVTCNVPQGLVLRPVLWNILYDPLLKIKLPVGAKTVAFADDLVLLTMARTEVELIAVTN